VTTRTPLPEFTLDQLDSLLTERSAADVASLATRYSAARIEAALSWGGPPWSAIADGLLRDVAAHGDELRRAAELRRAMASHWLGFPHRPMPRTVAKITERLRNRITFGTIRPGEMVPTAAELAALCGVHPATVNRATIALVAEGLLVMRYPAGERGRRVYVAQTAEEPREVQPGAPSALAV
jgi:Bacterial regulatory proteins, gntR family